MGQTRQTRRYLSDYEKQWERDHTPLQQNLLKNRGVKRTVHRRCPPQSDRLRALLQEEWANIGWHVKSCPKMIISDLKRQCYNKIKRYLKNFCFLAVLIPFNIIFSLDMTQLKTVSTLNLFKHHKNYPSGKHWSSVLENVKG